MLNNPIQFLLTVLCLKFSFGQGLPTDTDIANIYIYYSQFSVLELANPFI